MAVVQVEDQYPKSFPKEYIGESTDAKPTIDVSKGSTFYEKDTGKIYLHNGTSWSLMI